MSNEIRPEDVRRIAAQKEREVFGEDSRRFAEPHFGSARPRAADNPYMRSPAPRPAYDAPLAQPGFLERPRQDRYDPGAPVGYAEADEADDLSLPPNYAGAVYSGGAAEEEEPARRGRRLPVLLALLALVAFAGVLYVAYDQMQAPSGSASGEPPVIQAQAGEEKVKPADEGGIEVPNQEATVLNPTAAERTEVLMPPPEEPVAPPAPTAPALPAAGTAAQPVPAPAATEPSDGDKLAALLLATTTGTAGVQAGPAPAATEATPPSTATAALPAPAPVAGAPQPIAPQPLAPQPLAPQTAAVPATPVAPSIGAGDFLIQLASLTSSDAAQQTWSRLQQKHPDLLGDMGLRVQEADIEGKGKYYRVQAGPLPNRATADDMCALLKAQQQDCIVVKR